MTDQGLPRHSAKLEAPLCYLAGQPVMGPTIVEAATSHDGFLLVRLAAATDWLMMILKRHLSPLLLL